MWKWIVVYKSSLEVNQEKRLIHTHTYELKGIYYSLVVAIILTLLSNN